MSPAPIRTGSGAGALSSIVNVVGTLRPTLPATSDCSA
jgi:hypothetical protein